MCTDEIGHVDVTSIFDNPNRHPVEESPVAKLYKDHPAHRLVEGTISAENKHDVPKNAVAVQTTNQLTYSVRQIIEIVVEVAANGHDLDSFRAWVEHHNGDWQDALDTYEDHYVHTHISDSVWVTEMEALEAYAMDRYDEHNIDLPAGYVVKPDMGLWEGDHYVYPASAIGDYHIFSA